MENIHSLTHDEEPVAPPGHPVRVGLELKLHRVRGERAEDALAARGVAGAAAPDQLQLNPSSKGS